jgi:hypothetical protein
LFAAMAASRRRWACTRVRGQWGEITGALTPDSPVNQLFAGLYNWLARTHSADEAPTLCGRTFTGGRVKLIQYRSGGFDANYACF